MKKKHGMILLSLFIIMTSVTLLINKTSYAGETPGTNYCPETITLEKSSTLELISGIPLSKLEGKGPDGEKLNNTIITESRDIKISSEQTLEKGEETLLPIPRFSNKEENSYYTQLFYWWTNDLYFQKNNLTEEEKEIIRTSPNGKKIAEKIEEYEKLQEWQSSGGSPDFMLDEINTDHITYYVTDEYIETSLITPDCTKEYSYLFTNYEVNVSSPIIVVDEKENEKQEFQRDEGFKLRVPLSEVINGTINITAEIIGNATFDIWSSYAHEKKNVNPQALFNPIILVNCGESESIITFQPLELSYTEQVGNLTIKVIDAATKENLSNAEIVIYDSLGNMVYRKETTDKEISVTLPIGDYTVKQIVTPPNYQARVVEQRVTVTENETTEAVLENIQLVDVPDLGRRTTGIVMMIGGLTLIIGSIIIGANLRKNNLKN